MIKVAARNKFSQKLTPKLKKNNQISNDSSNTLGIFINGENFYEFVENFQSEKSCKSKAKSFNNLHVRKSPKNTQKNNDLNFIKQSNQKKNSFVKFPIPQNILYENKNSNTVQYEKLNDEGSNTIKIESKYTHKNLRSGRKSKTLISSRASLRSSAVKKTSNLIKSSDQKKSNTLTKKVSIFNDVFGGIKQSEHYQDFLKQSNFSQKIKSKEVINQVKNFKQNKQNRYALTEGHSKSFFQRQSLPKFHDESRNTQKKIENFQENYLFVKLPKQRQQNQQKQNISNENEQNCKGLFKNSTQEFIDQNITNSNQKPKHQSFIQQNQQSEIQKQLKKQVTLKNAQKVRVISQIKQKQETQQFFRKLSRQMASKKQMQKFSKKSQNFYEQLRIKMLKKYDMMMKDYRLDDKQKQKVSMLIQGCNLQKHRRVSNFGNEKKQTNFCRRPETAGAIREASKDIYSLNYVQKKKRNTLRARPSSCNPKSQNFLQQNCSFNRLSYAPDCISSVCKYQKERKSVDNFQNNQSKSQYDIFFQITNPNIKSISMLQNDYASKDEIIFSKNDLCTSKMVLTKKNSKENLVVQKNLLSSKFNNLMNICDKQSTQHFQTKKKMKVFQYYCSKVDNGFQKMSQKIKNTISHF